MGHREPVAVLLLFQLTYALWHWAPANSAPFFKCVSLGALVVLLALLLVRRVSELLTMFEPFTEPNTTAVFIAGCDERVALFTALRFCNLDVRVYAGVSDPTSKTAQWLDRYTGENLVLVRMDPTSKADVHAAAATIRKTLGDRILIAAVYANQSIPKVSDTLDMDEIQRGIELNAFGAVNLSQHFGPLLEQCGGRLVIISDLAGKVTFPSLLPYCMSQNIAHQFINGIRKNMEKLSVSVHVVEHILNTWGSIQQKSFYPAISKDGKVKFAEEIRDFDNTFDISQSIHQACFSKHPKPRYLPTVNDYIMDKIISYGPRCLLNWTISHIEEIKNIRVPTSNFEITEK